MDLGKFVSDLRRDKQILEESRGGNGDGDSYLAQVAMASLALSPIQIKVLDSVDFAWVDPDPPIRKLSWKERYADLLKHHSEHGDCYPQQDKVLMKWCSRQRYFNHRMLQETVHTDPEAQGTIGGREEGLQSKHVWAERKVSVFTYTTTGLNVTNAHGVPSLSNARQSWTRWVLIGK